MHTELTRLLINKSRAPSRIRFVDEKPREFFRSVKVRPDTLEYLWAAVRSYLLYFFLQVYCDQTGRHSDNVNMASF